VIFAVAAFGTKLLGVPTTYGSGVDSSLGAQVVRDFLADQDAEATALSNGDQSLLGGRLSDSALADVIQQINKQPSSGTSPKVSFQPTSLTVLRVRDPADPSLTIQVQEEGIKSVVMSNDPNTAPTEQAIAFHGDFWLRNSTGGHYTIADQQIQNLPSSPLPAIAVVGAALLVVGLTALLVRRQRLRRPAFALVATVREVPVPVLIEAPLGGGTSELPGPAPKTIVSTFGGLHIREGGQDWAQALMSRPVTGFVWLRLLVAGVLNPGSQVARDEVAGQASPRQSRDVQLKRLRNVISKGLHEMPSVLRARILVMPESMSFNLEDCEIDAIELINLSAATAGRRELSATEAARVQRVLAACQGTFLPEFEAIEDFATDHRPTCTELIRELRESLVEKRVALSLLLADALLRAGRPADAVRVLEPALTDRPGRKDLADRLVAAYRGAGRDAEAKALEARYE
jgi:DNA-binding SARP family transcriptional activator